MIYEGSHGLRIDIGETLASKVPDKKRFLNDHNVLKCNCRVQ